jgi:hypothetical protein
MRLGGSSAWTSLACLGAVLAVASGCKIPTSEDGQNGEGNKEDPSKFVPGTDPNKPGGPNTYVPGGPGTMVARKLALDLSGVAGFAILDDESQDSMQMASGDLSGVAPSSDMGASSMRLESSISGQVLARKVDRGALERIAQGRLGQPGPTAGRLGASRVSGMSAEDPGANTTPPSGDTTAPAPAPTPETDATVGEQAGLLKITEDGEIVPALVALEPDPVATPPAEAPAQGDPNGAAGSGGAGGEAPTGTDPIGAAGSGGAGGEPPTGTDPIGVAGTGGAGSGSGSGTPTGSDPNGAPPPGNTGPRAEPLPRVTALGLSPDGSVYVLFQHGFFYRQPTAEEAAAPGFDPYSQQSPFRCQLFRADGSWRNGASGQALAALECVTNQYEVPTWDTRRVMQFDASGKLYFRAVTPANPQGVFVQFDPTTQELSEKVNANICWRDVQVTPRGSLFYTGSTGTNGDCSGTSFFRYVSTDNRLTEIARDWWNFKYLAEQDPEDPNNERIIFYGPDPNSTGGFTWDSACLYRYNPAIETPAERTQKLVDCNRDGWSYVNGQSSPGAAPVAPSDADVPNYQARCESEGQLFIGGEGVSAISQLEDGTLFVVGSFQRKLAGELGCGLNVNVDHCAVGTGGPGDALDAASTTQEACIEAGHTWIRTTPWCSVGNYATQSECQENFGNWNFGSPRGYQMTGPACATVRAGITRNHIECHAPSNQPGGLSETVEGLGYLVAATETTAAHIQLLSDPTERVERYWPVPGPNGAELFYSVYSAGQYNLRMATQVTTDGTVTVERRSLLDDYEVYNLQRDPAHPTRVMFDALQFSTNNYLFGSIDANLATPEEVQASVETVSGVSGRVETLIVLPNF